MYSTPAPGSSRPSGATSCGTTVGPGPGAVPSVLQTCWSLRFQNSSCRTSNGSSIDWPRYVTCAPRGTARSTQSSGRGMLSSCALATLCDARAKLISPYAFQARIAPAATAATGTATRAEAKRRNSSSAAEREREHDEQRRRAVGVSRAPQRGQDGEPGRVEEDGDVEVVRRHRHEQQHERRSPRGAGSAPAAAARAPAPSRRRAAARRR